MELQEFAITDRRHAKNDSFSIRFNVSLSVSLVHAGLLVHGQKNRQEIDQPARNSKSLGVTKLLGHQLATLSY